MHTILSIQNLTKRYGGITAVKNLSFDLEEGNVYGILGPNGSGKSTTLGIVLNVVNKTSGSFQWFNGSMTTHQALKKIGAIIEHPNFYPNMTAYQNLKLVCRIKNSNPEGIDEKLKIVGLFDRKASKFKTFSLGMKQRLAIASALLNDPKILILDEPTNGLDPQGIHQIRAIIHKIAATGTTILLASHLLDEVEKICSHVIVIRKGQKLYDGPVDAISSDHGYFELKTAQKEQLFSYAKTQSDFGKITLDKASGLIRVILENPVDAAEMNKQLFAQGIVLSHLCKRQESLEERFLELTNSQN